MSDWISIIPKAVEKQASNASTVYQVWMDGDAPDNWTAGGNKGNAADQLMLCANEAKEIRTAMGTLLQNTIDWCRTVKVNFETTDNS